MKLPYKPQDIRNFFAYSYEFIDCFDFMRNPYEIIENYIEYEKFIIERIKNIRVLDNFYFEAFDTDSCAIQAMWIPPFAIVGILEDGLIQFENKQGIHFSINEQEQCGLGVPTDKRWTMGLVLFHVKNIKSGESLILSPFQLSIPDYGLE
ncbi:hypothetical protein [Rothia aeria]|uniref:hypothetical protein n=1 Tax=Rothia aeria TaxID=172042 RepID=UPI00244D201B|nr:hypothetical protein [Rothia sp. RSM482]